MKGKTQRLSEATVSHTKSHHTHTHQLKVRWLPRFSLEFFTQQRLFENAEIIVFRKPPQKTLRQAETNMNPAGR